MSRQKRLSKLTLAATILVAASATSFAQTESTKSRTEATSDVAVAMNLPNVTNAPKAIERRDNGNVATTDAVTSVSTASPSFSAAKFMAAVNQSVSDTSLTAVPRTNSELRFEPKFEQGTEEFSAPTKTPRITFVPSRGQKLPTY